MRSKRVKVSVLIPTYNGAEYLGEAIESVLAQTLTDFELIIADDQSSDGSQEIARRYAANDSRVFFYQNEINLGCVKNINRLILNARGEYIKVLIQDDVLGPTCLERFAGVLDSHPDVALVTSYQRFIGERSEVRKVPTIPAIGKLDGAMVQRHILSASNWIGGETAVMVRSSSLCVGLFNPDWVWQVDQDLWLRVLSTGHLYALPEILTYPRIHGQQNTVLLNKGFTFIKEELMQLQIAFLFPNLYGTYSEQERHALIERHLKRLVDKAMEEGADSHRAMVEIGRAFGVQFWHVLALAYLKRVRPRAIFEALPAAVRSVWRRISDWRWKRRFDFHAGRSVVDLGFGRIDSFGAITLPLGMLRSPILTPGGWNVVEVEQTPHYRWIKDLVDGRDDAPSRDEYRQYLTLFHPDEDIDATLVKIPTLVDAIRTEASAGIKLTIAAHPPSIYKGHFCAVIYDGNHRASIAKALGHVDIYCRLVNIRMKSDYFPPNFFCQQPVAG